MRTDYKFWYITRDDDGYITECAVRFYEGEFKTVKQKDISDFDEKTGEFKEIDVLQYIRSKKLTKTDLPHITKGKTKNDNSGEEVIVFTSDDFGVISTDDELRKFLNREIVEDKVRQPLYEQCDPDGKDRLLKDRPDKPDLKPKAV